MNRTVLAYDIRRGSYVAILVLFALLILSCSIGAVSADASTVMKVVPGEISNGTLPVDILIEGLPQGQSLEGCNLKLTFNSDQLQYNDAVQYGSYLPGWTWYPTIKDAGYIEFSGAKFPSGTNPTTTAGTLLTVTFNITGNGTAHFGITDIHLQDSSYVDISVIPQGADKILGESATIKVECGQVSNCTLPVNILIEGLSQGQALEGCNLKITYDSNLLQYSETVQYGSYLPGWTWYPAIKDAGYIEFSGAKFPSGTNPATAAGTILSATFNVTGNGTAQLGLVDVHLQDALYMDIPITMQTDQVELSGCGTKVVPSVATGDATKTSSTATLNGSITSNGGAVITDYGFYWGTSANPTTKKSVGTNNHTGAFTGGLSGLTADTTYYYKAYATNEKGEGYGEVKSFKTEKVIVKPTVTTVAAGNVDNDSATINGNITSNGGANITDYGFYWGTSSNPTTQQRLGTTNYIGAISFDLSGLSDGTKYYFKAYATNSMGVTNGDVLNFTTGTINKPTVTTGDAGNVDTDSATLNGNISSNGGGAITDYGFYWGTSSNPTTKQSLGTTNYTGSISFDLGGLSDGTKYYFKAYATNSKGTTFGSVLNFTTVMINKPTVTTSEAGNVDADSATLNGNIASNGGGAITDYGFYWGTNSNPATKQSLGTTNYTGALSFDLSGLSDGTKYYFKAYATNTKGTTFGTVLNFTTGTINKPTVTTADAGNVDTNSATLNGNITSNGGADITDYGFYWGTSNNPATKLQVGTDNHNGTFSYELNSLTPGATYYYKAYAKNIKGESLGVVKSFTVSQNQVNVILSAETDISDKRPLEISGTTDEEADWEVKITDATGKTLITYNSPNKMTSFNWAYSPNLPDLPIVSTYTLEVTATLEGGEKLSYTKEFEVSNYDLKISSVNVQSSGTSSNITAKVVNLGSENETVQGICQIVSQNGTYLLDITEQIPVGETEQTLQFSFSNLKSGTYKVQVFVWGKEDGAWLTKSKPYPENLSDTLSFTI